MGAFTHGGKTSLQQTQPPASSRVARGYFAPGRERTPEHIKPVITV
ncbi:MAG: hypothetical protein ACUVRU_00885 [Anaerolineae bacterium]